jgi:hypothetical protein
VVFGAVAGFQHGWIFRDWADRDDLIDLGDLIDGGWIGRVVRV